MNKHLLSLLFAAFCLSAAAEVNYQVIPLPQQIVFDKSGQQMVLSEGMTVGYPAGNQQMKRNAEFAAEYLGLSVTADKKGADVNLTLGLKSSNPDDYAISINKKGITIQGASESGVFYGIQTLRKSIMNETGEVRLDTVLHATLGSTNVHILNLSTFGEVLHDGGTVEDGINLQISSEVAGDVAQNDLDTLAKEFLE